MLASCNPSNSMNSRRKDDIVIAVMGATGSGKSSLINLLTGEATIKIGDSLESETDKVQGFSFVDTAVGRNVTVVDSPGFDDSREGMTDTDVLKKIASFLLEEYDAKRKLNGLVFVQRISDPRFSGQSNRNLKIFRNLCGTETYKNVVVVTTFWDKVGREEGARREAQLQNQYFSDLVQRGAHFIKHNRTKESAHQILKHVFTLIPAITQIQQEIREEGKALEDTAAGSVHREEIELLISKHQKEIAALKAEMETIQKSNRALKQELQNERAVLREKLAKWEIERAALKEGLDHERKSREKLEADAAIDRERNEKWRGRSWSDGNRARIESPPPYEVGYSVQSLPSASTRNAYKFAHSDKYPPYLKSIPQRNRTNVLDIFDFSALADTAATLLVQPVLLPQMRGVVPTRNSDPTTSMHQIVTHNQDLHQKARENARYSQSGHKLDMYFKENIGHRDDWYTDAAFGQQQFTGTNPTTITLASRRWIEEFKTVSINQQRADVTRLLSEVPANIYVQDYSDFRSTMGVSPSAEFTSHGRYGCSSVALFHLGSEGELHPLAVTLDYRGSMEDSVTIFNRRIASADSGNEAADWPWRYAKMCAQVSDWFRHEVTIHLVNTHLVEEVIIVAVNRSFEPFHIIFKLLEPHWSTTLSLNAAARETLVPKIIIGMTGFTPKQTYAFLKHAYNRFDWTGLYVPNDLRNRGFPIEDLNKPKYHNYGYARNIADMWNILRKFVSTVLQDAYPGGDAQVANDKCINALCQEVRSSTGGQLSSFPVIRTLDELIDFATMYIHIASPQHTAVNYLQQYYQTFVPNKPSALYNRLPQSLGELQRFTEKDVVTALPILRPRDWWIMAQVPYLLSFEMPEDCTLLQYATAASNSPSTPEIIRNAARTLAVDLDDFSEAVVRYSRDLDDQQTPYNVLHPSKTAISILI